MKRRINTRFNKNYAKKEEKKVIKKLRKKGKLKKLQKRKTKPISIHNNKKREQIFERIGLEIYG